jgi:hypothetical protein
MTQQQRVCWLALGLGLGLGCGSAAEGGDDAVGPALFGTSDADRTLAHAASIVAQAGGAAASGPMPCARKGRNDVVRDVFCSVAGRHVTSMAELQSALGFPSPAGEVVNARSGAVLLAYSTALSGELVSELNPRAIIASDGRFIAFTRGMQQVELAVPDRRAQGQSNLYLLQFRQACNRAAEGCRPGDLYTPQIESNWQELTLFDDEDLKNTPSDCRQCHQRGAQKTTLLMREFYSPWTHYFAPDSDGNAVLPEPTGGALLHDYLQAKGDEPYANLSMSILKAVVGFTLERVVDHPQPLLFDGSKILMERWPWSGGGYAIEPARSATWDEAFAAWKRGEQLPLPYYATRTTDPDKRAALSQAYQRYRAGELDAAELPDLAEIFPDDPQARAELGLQTEPAATPAQTLVEACGTCHNDVLDQSLSRARFSISLARMDREELDRASARILAAPSDAGVMPPPGRRQIARENLQALAAYLDQTERSADDDALLEHAAQAGMMGGADTGKRVGE